MKLIWRQILGYVTVIVVLGTILVISFVRVTDQTMYHQTWFQLGQYADSLIQDDEVIINKKTNQIVGFQQQAIDSKSKLLSRQHVYFAVLDAKGQTRYDNSQGYTAQISKADWKKLRQGKMIKKRIAYPNTQVLQKNHQNMPIPQMIGIIKPYFFNHKLVAVVNISTFSSTARQIYEHIFQQMLIAFAAAFIVALTISFLFAQSLKKRIDKMKNAANEIAEGNYDIHLQTGHRDELDELSDSFNKMTDSLQASQEEIKAQEERRKEFLADAAHEMRTPLTTINGLLEGLAFDAIPEEDRQHSIELMQKDTKRLIRLVNDNLNYEKIRTNQIRMDRQIFDASEVLGNLKDQLEPNAKEQGDEIIVKSPHPLRTYADMDRFVQIMFNIIQNAIQFTKNGTIKVTGERLPKGAQFSVTDNGIGMSDEQLKNIWQRFYKADRSRMNTQYGESGIGLSLVRQLVRLHNGKITVKSKVNHGTTFTIFFPDRSTDHQKTE
ncbi:sensor histidine kinase [Limosilactobacillus caecicola]|uniref:sensor histidine kinase n=1 Tax=Limosilactobacillus caecicola TaxID=2941332 RepID=UPI00203C8816|nr:HAMP domain-containing sensor histidine kinase [Limosilactobacillus caecicola]